MDGLPFTEFIPLTQEEGAGLGNGGGEKMMSSALVIWGLSWDIQ